MLKQGVPLRVAQAILGHSTIAVTADIYRHVQAESTRQPTDEAVALLKVGS